MSDICSDITLNMSGLRTQCLDVKEIVERETPYVNDMLFLVRLLNAAKNILAAKKDSDPNGQLKTAIFTAVYPYLAIGKVSNDSADPTVFEKEIDRIVDEIIAGLIAKSLVSRDDSRISQIKEDLKEALEREEPSALLKHTPSKEENMQSLLTGWANEVAKRAAWGNFNYNKLFLLIRQIKNLGTNPILSDVAKRAIDSGAEGMFEALEAEIRRIEAELPAAVQPGTPGKIDQFVEEGQARVGGLERRELECLSAELARILSSPCDQSVSNSSVLVEQSVFDNLMSILTTNAIISSIVFILQLETGQNQWYGQEETELTDTKTPILMLLYKLMSQEVVDRFIVEKDGKLFLKTGGEYGFFDESLMEDTWESSDIPNSKNISGRLVSMLELLLIFSDVALGNYDNEEIKANVNHLVEGYGRSGQAGLDNRTVQILVEELEKCLNRGIDLKANWKLLREALIPSGEESASLEPERAGPSLLTSDTVLRNSPAAVVAKEEKLVVVEAFNPETIDDLAKWIVEEKIRPILQQRILKKVGTTPVIEGSKISYVISSTYFTQKQGDTVLTLDLNFDYSRFSAVNSAISTLFPDGNITISISLKELDFSGFMEDSQIINALTSQARIPLASW
ncbi:hypothetical protein A3J90_08175 [candidate division WOR-1 bacterium RIFOXYC2_FULL_37_10]|uniref:Uncharacterized protein n=1 Tax=candidate division WOR-1 bacterium RIFOXYB2_FULL_37_13 TaxID=1802579 RepID=A0A1F4SQD2_UNCSA|nr:MAG: hypothetical protein A2310_07835 [candidate division WOR-1 bacterium RIFOXYB2_FULL_37_13]OGC37374.1 MAG: hypothetical protein A3J90_08175 [candidate division WOR-1 bacterium RIFOXYC2_FULL_37_10]